MQRRSDSGPPDLAPWAADWGWPRELRWRGVARRGAAWPGVPATPNKSKQCGVLSGVVLTSFTDTVRSASVDTVFGEERWNSWSPF